MISSPVATGSAPVRNIARQPFPDATAIPASGLPLDRLTGIVRRRLAQGD
ncbi:hypothetical protein ACFPTO_22680 [Paraburkholderia denitrificans]|uniref:Uncharacterized protein n=1 Tax=Paraburkholderia denitrificans TaxID=694025 RepID=A0ABW0JFC9_9BURK